MEDMLERLQSPDNAIRGEAERLFDEALKNNMQTVMNHLMQLILVGKDQKMCQFGAVLFRGQLVKQMGTGWFNGLSDGERQNLKSVLLERMKSAPSIEVRRQVGQIVAQIARLSMGSDGDDEWPTLLNDLARMSTFDGDDGSLAYVTLETMEEIVRQAPFKVEDEATISQLSQMVCNVMSSPPKGYNPTRVAGVKVMAAIFSLIEENDIDTFRPAFKAMISVVEPIHNDEDLLIKWCEAICEGIQVCPTVMDGDGLGLTLLGPMVRIAKNEGGKFTEDMRKQCLEVCMTLVSEVPKIVKEDVSVLQALNETCIMFMLEYQDADEEIDNDHMEGAAEEDTLMNAGARGLYVLCESLGGTVTLPILFPMIEELLQPSQDYVRPRTGLVALTQAAYSGGRMMYENISGVLERMLPYVVNENVHTKVRFVAMETLSVLFVVFGDVAGMFLNEEAEFDEEEEEKPGIHLMFTENLLTAINGILNEPTSNSKEAWILKDKAAMVASYFFSSFNEGELEEKDVPKAAEILQKLHRLIDLSGAIQEQQYLRFGVGYNPDAIDTTGAQGSALSAVGAIARAMGNPFSQFYDEFMPVAQRLYVFQEKVVENTNKAENNRWSERQAELRGIALDCIGMMGGAVGKDKFRKDAAELLNMIAGYMDASWDKGDDDRNRQVADLVSNICVSMETVDSAVLAKILPKFIQWAAKPTCYVPTQEELDREEDEDEDEEDDDKRKHLIMTDDDTILCFVPYQLKEKQNAIRVVQEIISSVGECIMPYAGMLGQLMSDQLTEEKIATTPDIILCSSFSLAKLLEATQTYLSKKKSAGAVTSEEVQFAQQLFEKSLSATLQSLLEELEDCKNDDEELMNEYKLGREYDQEDDNRSLVLTTIASQISSILRSAFQSGGLSDNNVDRFNSEGYSRETFPPLFGVPHGDIAKVMNTLSQCIQLSLERPRGNPWWNNTHLHEIMDSLSEAVGLLLKAHGDAALESFGQLILPTAHKILDAPVTKKGITASLKAVGLFFLDDMIEFGGARAVTVVPEAMEYFLKYSSMQNDAVRQSAVFGIGLCAEFGGPNFTKFLERSSNALLTCIDSPKSKKTSAACARDTAIGSFLKCIIFREQWGGLQKLLTYLPIKTDALECRNLYYQLYRALKNGNQHFLPFADRIGAIFVEVSKDTTGYDEKTNSFDEESAILSNETRAWIAMNIPGAMGYTAK